MSLGHLSSQEAMNVNRAPSNCVFLNLVEGAKTPGLKSMISGNSCCEEHD